MTRRSKRDDAAVKVETAIYRQARQIAARRDVTLAEYLSDLLRGPVEADYFRMVADMAQEAKKKPKGGGA
jgi:hypothetical protein